MQKDTLNNFLFYDIEIEIYINVQHITTNDKRILLS